MPPSAPVWEDTQSFVLSGCSFQTDFCAFALTGGVLSGAGSCSGSRNSTELTEGGCGPWGAGREEAAYWENPSDPAVASQSQNLGSGLLEAWGSLSSATNY